jgi:ABC-type amino acid transport substrate-binding protein
MKGFARTRQVLRFPAMALLFCVAQAAWAATDRTVEIYVENAAAPFSGPDGTGFANDVVKAAFEAVGVPIRFHVAPYARCKYMALSGEAAACVSMSWDPSFEGRIRFADTPLITVTPVYYENPSRPLGARSEAELGKGVVIGTVRGYEYPESAMKAKARGVVFEENSSEQNNLEKLALGRLDAVMVMSNPFTGHSHWALDAHVANLVRVAFTSTTSEYGYFGASTKHPGGLAALKQYNDGIRIITANGRLNQIRAQWTPHRP